MTLREAIVGLVGACRRDVVDCVGVGVVDLSTGGMLHSDTVDELPADLLELMGAATVDLFQGRAVRAVERAMSERRGGDHWNASQEGHAFEEILVRSPHQVHLFLRSRRHPDLALAVVCSGTVKLGLLLAGARGLLRDFDAAPVGVDTGRLGLSR
jgi:hypothetical protein